MDIVDQVAEFIGPHEGCANCKPDGLIYVYLCPAGYPTQGYGIRVKDMSVPPITKEEALRRFKKVIPIYVQHAINLSPILKDNPTKLVAITSFIYNLGPYSYAASTLRKRVDQANWVEAAKEIQKWVHGGGKKLPGLVKRRQMEAQLLIKDEV